MQQVEELRRLIHDLNNLVFGIRMFAETTRRKAAVDSDIGANMDEILKAVERASGCIEDIRRLYKEPVSQASPSEISTKVSEGAGERILFVDDEELLRRMGQQILRELGYEVEAVASGEEALVLFVRAPADYDLVITDQNMPDMSGADLARHLLQRRADLPIILCTGFGEEMKEEEARQIGVRRYLSKPVSFQDYTRAIREALDNET